MRGITNNKGLGSKGRFKSKLKSRKIKCFECYKVWHFRKNYPRQKHKKQEEETFNAKNLISEGGIFYDIESIFFVSVGITQVIGEFFNSGCIFYIYYNISWFDIYKVINDTILLGDNK